MIANKCACLSICVCISAISNADIQSRYYGSVFSGDISWMLSEQLDQKEDQSLVRHFKLRFIDRQEVPAFESIEDEFVRKIAGYYQDYWTDSLLDPNARSSREKLLEQRIEQALGVGRKTALSKLSGRDAITLWRMADEGEKGAMETLIRYNAEDVASLPDLASIAYDELSAMLPIDLPPAQKRHWVTTDTLPFDVDLVNYITRGR